MWDLEADDIVAVGVALVELVVVRRVEGMVQDLEPEVVVQHVPAYPNPVSACV